MAGYGFMIDTFLAFLGPLFPYTFDPLLTPLLAIGGPGMGAKITIATVSIALSGVLSIIYYLFMDVDRYQELQEERKEINKKMKQAQKSGDAEKANNYMQTMMGMQKEFFMTMMKPMLVSMVMFLTLLPWMYTTFNPVVVGQSAGNGYAGDLTYNGLSQEFTIQDGETPAIIVDGEQYAIEDTLSVDGLTWKVKEIDITESGAEAKFAAVIWNSPIPLPFTGNDIGWLATYILISIPFTYGFRKALGIQ